MCAGVLSLTGVFKGGCPPNHPDMRARTSPATCRRCQTVTDGTRDLRNRLTDVGFGAFGVLLVHACVSKVQDRTQVIWKMGKLQNAKKSVRLDVVTSKPQLITEEKLFQRRNIR